MNWKAKSQPLNDAESQSQSIPAWEQKSELVESQASNDPRPVEMVGASVEVEGQESASAPQQESKTPLGAPQRSKQNSANAGRTFPEAGDSPDAKEEGGLAQDVWGLYGMGSGSLVEGAGWLFGSDELQALGKDTAEYWQKTLSDAQKEAGQKRFISEEGGMGEALKDPRAYMGTAIQSLPAMVPGVGAAGLLGRAGVAVGMSRAGAAGLATAGASAGEGATIAGMMGAEVDATVKGLSEEQKLKSPYYQDLRKLHSEEEATQRLADMAANDAAIKSGVTGAALGYAFNKFLGNAVLGRLKGGPVKEGVKGGVLEGGTETAQSGTESYFRQDALEKYAGQDFVWTDLANEMVAGTVGGTAMGTGVGVAGGIDSSSGPDQDREGDPGESGLESNRTEPDPEPRNPSPAEQGAPQADQPVNQKPAWAEKAEPFGRPEWATEQTQVQPKTTMDGEPVEATGLNIPDQEDSQPQPQEAPAESQGAQVDGMQDNGTGTFRVPVDRIQVDPQQYQFRSRVNDRGVDKRLAGVDKWDDNRAQFVLLHRRNDGSLYVADGHHRVDLARRLGQGEINARILNESDGWTVPEARVEAAMNNIADDKASPIDAAKVFRDSGVPMPEVRQTYNLPDKQVVRDGESLAKLSDNVFGMVAAGQMAEKDGAAIGAAFSESGQQEAAASAFQKVEPQTEYQRQLLVNEIRASEFAEAQGEQGGLFGDDAQEVSLMQDRLKVLDSLRQRLNSDKRLFKSLNDNADRASEAGNQIATEANEGVTEQSARSLGLIGRVTTTPALNEMVNRAARRVYDGEKKADVVKDLKRELMNYEQGAGPESIERPDTAPSREPVEAAGQEQRAGERVPEQDTAGADQGGELEGGQPQVAPDLDLQAQTEQDLAEQDQRRQQAEQEKARQRREAEQRAQADAEADDFLLTGSDSQIDQAEARGQGNMFDAPVEQVSEAEPQEAPEKAMARMYRRQVDDGKAPEIAGWLQDESGQLEIQRIPAREIGSGRVAYAVVDHTGTRLKQSGTYRSSEKGATKAAKAEASSIMDALGIVRDSQQEAATNNPVEQKSKTAEESEPAQQPEPEDAGQKAQAADETPNQPEPTAPISDFGQKIEGARKDYASKLADAKEKDPAAVPLSESWPEPNYQSLLDSGADPMAVGFAHAARDEVPPKPRKGWKLKGWVRQVESLRNFAESVIDGSVPVDSINSAADGAGFESLKSEVLGRAELYAAVGHRKSLKGLRLFSAHYSIFDGEKGSFDKWVIESPAKTGAFGNMPRQLVTADSKQEAIDKFRDIHATLGDKTKSSKNTRFDIYSSRHDKTDIFIGKKIGGDVVRIREGFGNLKEARAYLQENQAELEDRLAKMKNIPNHRKEGNAPRVGKDHRNGGDATPEAFAETFGFRGVQFGNYVEQGRRQQDLNDAYDGLMDLAGILNVPAKALSLNGEMGLAFGARGKGGKNAPKAHYEPGNIVINLTKKDGAGSLAHEWFHSLDNYFSRERGSKSVDAMATEDKAAASVRPEVAETFRNVRQTVNRTKLKQRSQKLDKVRTKAYWSTTPEMTARAFESYVIEKLQDQGASNDYLANIVSEDYWKASEAMGMKDSDSYPYPEAAEIPEVRAAYDNLFQVIEYRESGDGVVELFSRKDGRPAKRGLPEAKVKAIVDDFLAKYPGANDVTPRIHKTAATLPGFKPERDGDEAGATIAGEYDSRRDTVHLVSSAFDSEAEVVQALQEEILVHKGLGFFKPEDRQQLYRDIQKAANESAEVKALWDRTVREYRPVAEYSSLNEEQSSRLYAEEMLGTLAQEQPNWLRRGWRTLREGIKRLLVRSGLVKSTIGMDELRSRIDLIATAFRRGRRAARRDFTADIRATDDVPAFSRTDDGIPVLDAQPFGPPSDTLTRRLVSKIADKFTVLKGVQDQIKQSSGAIPEYADAYTAEELFHGKVENDIRLIQEQMVEPLARDMAEYEISLSQLDEYLYAKYAPERNEVIAERNAEMPDGGSGMTDAEASEVISRIERSGRLGEYRMLADQVYRMLEKRRSILQEAGLLDEDALGAWEATYSHYVPLKGFAADESQDGRPRIGKGFAISGAESKIAGGRRSRSASPIAYSISDLSEAVLRHRKNEVGQAFLSLVREHPNDNYWKVYTDENPEVERKPVRVKDPETGKTKLEMREQTVSMAVMSDRYFTVKENGKTLYVKIQDERLMNAMRNVGPDVNGVLVRAMGSVTRVMSSLNTSYNPEFVISNFSRDIQTALLNLTSEQSSEDGKVRGERIAAKTMKDTGTAIRAINASLKGKDLKGKAGQWQQYFDQFRADGAKTGWFDMKDIDGQVQDIEKLVKMASGGPVSLNGLRRGFRGVTDWVENTNSAIENGVRLSAYVNAIEAGVSRERAASLAKNMTVNFNRRGELGTAMNAVYMFANASVQGTNNFIRTLGRLNGKKGDPMWRRMNTAQKIAAGMAVSGFMLSLMNRLIAGDDDDEVNWWDKVPDYVKERNIVIMKSLVGGEPGEYWTIPLPYGYNIFPVMGTQAEHLLFSDDQSAGKAASNVILAALGSFSPIGFEHSDEAYGTIMKNVTPTILRPLASLSLNENFMGGPIFKENFPFGTPDPNSSLSFRSTPDFYKAIAKTLNTGTGGNEQMSGYVDVSPDVMQYLVGYYGGGAYDFFTNRTVNFVEKTTSSEPLEDREIPFVRKLSGKALPYEDQSKFYDRRDEINQIVDRREAVRGRDRVDFMRDYQAKLRLKPLADSTEKRLRQLREQRKRLEASGSLSDKAKRNRMDMIEAQMKKAIDRFNLRYNAAE